ncbi:MAG: OmpH family outer membrane protein [Ignavibacteria bacterium]|nr:OmpH family outer membrane protein [Ignavibacteria bacterium]
MTRWIIVGVALLLPMLAVAQKVGYVSSDAIRTAYEPNRQAEERLNALVTEWKGELAQRQRDVDELEIEMKKNRLIWSDAERQQKDRELEDKRSDRDKFAREKFEPGGEHDKVAEGLFKAIWDKIYFGIQKVAAAEGYDMVWDKSVQPLVYVNAKYDITVKVMKELGIDADDLERKQKLVVEGDPRNQRAEEPRKRKSRRRSTSADVPEDPAPTDTQSNPNVQNAPLGPDGQPILPFSPPPKLPDTNPVPVDTNKREQDIPR